MIDIDRWRAENPAAPEGLLEAFAAYELALMGDDLAAMDDLFVDGPDTLRADPGGLLVGHEQIHDFRAVRGGAPARGLVRVVVHELGPDAASIVAVTAPSRGGHGAQSQVWRRCADGGWRVLTAHVAPPPATFDRSVWRVVGDPLLPATRTGGPLAGESVAVKDLFAVSGQPIGVGVPAWLAEQRPQARDSDAVARLRASGAEIRGIARTDQFAYSLAGDNRHYGTPVNPVVPGALPGGSSSGSAVAVSLGAASIGLATDTAGSVRVPASYQGLWGWRSTHGAVPTGGLVPLAQDFDTVGVIAREPGLLDRVAAVLLPDTLPVRPVGPAVRSVRVSGAPGFDGVDAEVAARFDAWAGDTGLAPIDLPDPTPVAEAFRVHQAWQAWQNHGAWITAHPGALVGAAEQRFEAARHISSDENAVAVTQLTHWRHQLDDLLGEAVLALPSAASAAPRVWASPAEVDAHRSVTFNLTCVAGVTRRPAVSAPLLTTDAGPVGISFVGPRHGDRALIGLAGELAGR